MKHVLESAFGSTGTVSLTRILEATHDMNSSPNSKSKSTNESPEEEPLGKGCLGCLGLIGLFFVGGWILQLSGWVYGEDSGSKKTTEATVEETSTTISEPTTISELTWSDNLKEGVSATDLVKLPCAGLKLKIEERVALVWARLAETEKPSQDQFKSADFVRQVVWVNDKHLGTTEGLLRAITAPLLKAGSKEAPTKVQRSEFLNEAISACNLGSLSAALDESASALDDRLESMIWSANNLPWYPDGFEEAYPGVAFRKSERGLDCYSCSGIIYEVITQFSCPNQLYVEANFIDSNGTIFDWTNDSVRSLSAGQIAYVELYTYSSGSGQRTISLTKADCF